MVWWQKKPSAKESAIGREIPKLMRVLAEIAECVVQERYSQVACLNWGILGVG
ncbi:MAG: hypothetical protein KAI84_10440 [Gammaproteobacteria bacterium]|nr:hypothetical protein [Gammaproteobacteria bacterium]